MALPPADAFLLFTRQGERSWVPDWKPTYPAGREPGPEQGLVFTTGTDDEIRTCVVARFDLEERRATYVYVLPGRRAARVEVAVEPGSSGGRGSLARLTYHVTSLAPDGDHGVAESARGFDAMLDDWTARVAERDTA